MLRRRIGLRLFLMMALLVTGFEAIVFSQNQRLLNRFRVQYFQILLDDLEGMGDLARCDADPAAWSHPDRGLGSIWALDERGFPFNPQAPLQAAFPLTQDVRAVRIVEPRVNWLGWSGVTRMDRGGACQRFLLVQPRMINVDGLGLLRVGVARFLAALLLILGTWWLVVRPLVRRVQRHATRTQEIVAADFHGSLEQGSGDELDHLVNAFNQAAAVARERLERLEAQDRLTRNVLANLAHDLRTPLAALKIGVGRLLDDQPRSQVAHTVRSELNYLDALIGNLTALVKLEGTSLPLVRQPIFAEELVQRVSGRFRLAARGRTVSLEVAVEDETLQFPGDPVAVEQALGNLVHNAVDFARANVAVVCFAREGRVVFQVLDDGPGLENDEIPKLSLRSFQGSASRSRGRKGQGLGLAIAREVAERHGGGLRAAAPPEGGTRMELFFPL